MWPFLHNLFFSLSPFVIIHIVGKSMFPVLIQGDRVLVNKAVYWFARPCIGDIVACKDPRNGNILIKRITKREGGTYFVEGDNKRESTDSRAFGWIKKKDIIGKVISTEKFCGI